VQSSESATFLDPDGIVEFFRRFGVMADDETRTTRKEE